MKTFSKCKLVPTHHHTIHIHCYKLFQFNVDFGSEDNAEEKRQSKLDIEEKHRERRDRETAEERDCCTEIFYVQA